MCDIDLSADFNGIIGVILHRSEYWEVLFKRSASQNCFAIWADYVYNYVIVDDRDKRRRQSYAGRKSASR